jgi:hypothetical protein
MDRDPQAGLFPFVESKPPMVLLDDAGFGQTAPSGFHDEMADRAIDKVKSGHRYS